MKQCRACKIVKQMDDFYKHPRMPDGFINQCKVCRDAYVKAWANKNRERKRKIAREWASKNYDVDKAAERNKRCYEKSKGTPAYAKVVQRVNARRLHEKRATPLWADDQLIAEFFNEAQRLTVETGILWTVDHIVPITSVLVCGLHTQDNLQLMTKAQNSGKRNRHWPDMPLQ